MLFSINPANHLLFLQRALKQHIKEGTFASFAWKGIGAALYDRFVEWPDPEMEDYSTHFSVPALFEELYTGWTLDPRWLADDEEHYETDEGVALPDGIEPIISPVEHLAAYGLWIIEELPGAGGEFPAQGEQYNDHGHTHEDILQHRAECLLLAYQALTYIQRFQAGEQGPTPEIKRAIHAALSLKGAEKRHEETRKLKEEAFLYWSENIDPNKSNDDAAELLRKQIPLALRTLSRYVGEFKKRKGRLPVDGTPF